MIPPNISREHILKAIENVVSRDIPIDRHSIKWSVLYNNTKYPPKYIISIANFYANGEELHPSDFSGGEETNSFLQKLGFKIIRSGSKQQEFPIESHSWKVLSKTVAIKVMDKSSFLHHGTAIPLLIRPFFGIEDFAKTFHKVIHIHNKGHHYRAYFEMRKKDQRVRLFWQADLARMLNETLPQWHNAFANDKYNSTLTQPPIMRFKKLNENYSAYALELICPDEIQRDIEAEIAEEQQPKSEGTVKYYYGKRYERDPYNRSKAIELHGCSCIVCGFDFEKHYGERGKGFIEIHHTKPLSTFDEEQVVNPETELIPVCPNCHRMIHRRKDNVLSVETLKNILKSKDSN